MLALLRHFHGGWLTRGIDADSRAPAEAVVLRCIGLGFLVVLFITTFTTRPVPALHGRGVIVLTGLALLVASAIASQPQRVRMVSRAAEEGPQWRIIAALTGVIAGSILLTIEQPNGIWQAGPYFVAIMAATRLDRRTGTLMVLAAITPFAIISVTQGRYGNALSEAIGVAPWYLLVRLMRRLRDQRDLIDASRAAEAQAAALTERGRLAREMHDVLAHSLSAQALQLETTRLLARDRGVDEDLANAIDQAHHLAVSGLEDARRAIAAARGEELPGPERLEALAGAFGEQSGLTVDVAIRGAPHALAPDARLAVYRTAQEALTNVRRHAAPERVCVSLDYLPDSTVLVVEDHAAWAISAPAKGGLAGDGYGLAGMRERARLLGGELWAGPTAGGFRVELRLPCAAASGGRRTHSDPVADRS